MSEQYIKDVPLLRPFDLEAAKDGELLCDNTGCNTYKIINFITRYSTGEITLSVVETNTRYEYHNTSPSYLKMKPLAWVEGKPVYKGDVLYNKIYPSYRYDVKGISTYGTILSEQNETGSFSEEVDNLTWNKPKQKVKRKVWINVYPDGCHNAYDSKEMANKMRVDALCIACVETEIEYEV